MTHNKHNRKNNSRRVQASKQARWARKSGAYLSPRMAALLVAESGQARQFAHPASA